MHRPHRLIAVAAHLRPPLLRGAMSTFTHPTHKIPITLPPDHGLSADQLLEFGPFKTWLSTLTHSLSLQRASSAHPFYRTPYKLESITVQSVDFFGGRRIGFIKLSAAIRNAQGEKLPGSVFLRGGSVAILLILEVAGREREKWAVLTVQPRIPAGSLEMVELPAGMLDNAGTFSGAAAKEIKEECGIEIAADELVDMTALALGPLTEAADEKIEPGVYPSPGGSDEWIKCFAVRKTVQPQELDGWRGRLTGLRGEGEKITLKLVPLERLWRETCDGKTLASVALWEGLRREGRI